MSLAHRFGLAVFCTTLLLVPGAQTQSPSAAAAATQTPAAAQGTLFTPAQLAALLPPSVYFQGRSAPVQLRNAAGIAFAHDATLWVALVDSSGYSTSVQEKYQFYLVTEAPLRIGSARLPAGAYGGGFQGSKFLVMDIGGHTIAQGPVQTDAIMKRPRPLEFVQDGAGAIKFYLGRHWVLLSHSGS